MSENLYKTKQRSLMFQFLKDNCENALTVDEIVDMLKQSGENIGRTTVYRFVESLSKSGEVRKFFDENKKCATFQFLSHHESCQKHLHLKCTECGKLIHLGCDFMDGVCSHIEEHHKFKVDNSITTLLGICDECAKKEKSNETD